MTHERTSYNNIKYKPYNIITFIVNVADSYW